MQNEGWLYRTLLRSSALVTCPSPVFHGGADHRASSTSKHGQERRDAPGHGGPALLPEVSAALPPLPWTNRESTKAQMLPCDPPWGTGRLGKRMHPCTQTQTHIHTHKHRHTHRHTHINTQRHTGTHTHRHKQTHRHTHRHRHTQIDTDTPKNRHKHKDTDTLKHM